MNFEEVAQNAYESSGKGAWRDLDATDQQKWIMRVKAVVAWYVNGLRLPTGQYEDQFIVPVVEKELDLNKVHDGDEA